MTVSEFNEEYNGNMEVFKKMECKNLASKRLSAILPPRPSDDEYVSQTLNLLQHTYHFLWDRLIMRF
jgi:hypothetical protein